jgi:NAD(P)-dependent dehydrogenase (short-subunit alcohol dehydrogenase family)
MLYTDEKLELFNLSGKTAIVTGSTRGIGNAIAFRFAQQGANVVVCGTNAEKAQAVAKEINQKIGANRAIGAKFDLTDRKAPEPLVEEAVSHFGGLDILVCNALWLPQSPLTSTEEADLNAAFDANVSRNVRLSNLSIPHMQRRGGGSIVYVSSTMALFASSFFAYSVSKAALHRVVQNQALLLGRHKINVNALAPGFTDTDAAAYTKENPDKLKNLFAELPMGRFAKPDEMAACAVFLASPGGAYTTGQIIAVEGGQLLEGTTATRRMI